MCAASDAATVRIVWACSVALVLLVGTLLAARSFTPSEKGPSRREHARVAPRGTAFARTAFTPVVATTTNDVLAGNGAAAAALDARARLGQKLFFDATLSEPPGTSCAACHDPQHGYAGLNGSERGVPRGSRPGHFARRSAPSLMYLRFVPRLHVEWDDEAENPEARGGFFWDGRVSSLAELVRQPLLNPDEMANPNLDAIAKKLARLPYAGEMRAEIDRAFDTTESASEALGLCLEAFLTSRALSPFSSRYDDFVRAEGTLSPLELQGLALFKDPEKGACNSCHRLDDVSHEPERSLFTDFGYDVVTAPRNTKLALPVTSFDLGLCERPDAHLHTDDPWYCGAFRTPSLRNVALRQSFFHNGTFTNLRDVVRFYATRSTSPTTWYPDGKFDDLPERYWQYVNTTTPPYNRRPGDPPALDDAEIDAVVAFLGTLSDREILPAPARE
ncbi:MAG TPA: cytochrome c peroxidase [Polyangiaceae bacterium]|jgi:cytochrome c peroxidase